MDNDFINYSEQFSIINLKLDNLKNLFDSRLGYLTSRIDDTNNRLDQHESRISVIEKTDNQRIGSRSIIMIIVTSIVAIGSGVLGSIFDIFKHI